MARRRGASFARPRRIDTATIFKDAADAVEEEAGAVVLGPLWKLGQGALCLRVAESVVGGRRYEAVARN